MGGSGSSLKGDNYQYASIATVMKRTSFEQVSDGVYQMDTIFGGGEITRTPQGTFRATAWNGRNRNWFENEEYQTLNDAKNAIKNTILTRTTSYDVI